MLSGGAASPTSLIVAVAYREALAYIWICPGGKTIVRVLFLVGLPASI